MSHNFTLNEDLPALSNVQRIALEGQRIDRPRNVRRIVVETATDLSGASACGHRITPPDVEGFDPRTPWKPAKVTQVPTRIEIYVDQLPALLERVRTAEHEQIIEQAKALADRKNAAWIKKNAKRLDSMNEHDRAQYIYFHQPAHWPGELSYLGLRSGAPPLTYARVLHPQTGESMDAREWLSLPVEERVSWTLGAPPTPLNQQEKATEHMADVIARAFEKMNERAEGSRARK